MDILCFANILSFLHCYKNKTKTGAKSDGWCEGVNRCSVHVSVREEWVVLTDDISINNITHAHIENKAARSVQDGVENGCWMTGEGKHHKCHSDRRKNWHRTVKNTELTGWECKASKPNSFEREAEVTWPHYDCHSSVRTPAKTKSSPINSRRRNRSHSGWGFTVVLLLATAILINCSSGFISKRSSCLSCALSLYSISINTFRQLCGKEA